MGNRALFTLFAVLPTVLFTGCGVLNFGSTSTLPGTARTKISTQEIATTLSHVRGCLDARMVTRWTDPATGQVQQYPPDAKIPSSSELIGAAGYPAGVIYSGMLSAADATGDTQFSDFVAHRFDFFASTLKVTTGPSSWSKKNPYHSWISPTSLDSCGAVGASFIKARRAKIGGDLQPAIDRFAKFITHKQLRLSDGTLARKRPFPNSLWADDMYMSVPFLAQMGALTGNASYTDDAARQVTQISDRLFVPAAGLFMHGWNARTGDAQPHFYWGRANGWCAMSMVELLDVLPADHPKRARILKLLQDQAKGLASTQSGSGLWHQILDRQDSFLETSCSAMFTFAIARGVNRGWLDASAYGPVAIAGWRGVASKIDAAGHVTGTCVGTSYADDFPYYYDRTATDDQHGYGPVLLAGSEIIRMLKNTDFHIQDDPAKPVMFTHGPVEQDPPQ